MKFFMFFTAVLMGSAAANTQVVAYNFGHSMTSSITRIYADAPQSERTDVVASDKTSPHDAYQPLVELARDVSMMMAVVDPNQI